MVHPDAARAALTSLLPRPLASTRTTRACAIAAAAALTAVAAQFSIPLPFTPAPLTLQPTLVLLAGVALGARAGAASQLTYLIIGALGAPIFAWSPVLLPGLGRVFGPTGGYLLSYPLAAWLVGYVVERGRRRGYTSSIVGVLAMTAGLATIYLGGMASLLAFAPDSGGWGDGTVAFQLGVLPFVGADLLKIALAAPLLSTLASVRTRWFDAAPPR